MASLEGYVFSENKGRYLHGYFPPLQVCNMDYISILDGRIPAYYEVAECENNDLIISYWYFYGYKDDCPMLPGDPGDDVNWGRYVVKVNPEILFCRLLNKLI